MQKLDLTKVKKNLKPDPIFKGMSKYLKDPKNFMVVENKLQDVLKSDHKHKTASSYVKCKECQTKYQERKARMKELGFKSIQQYLAWKKIHVIIRDKKSFQLR